MAIKTGGEAVVEALIAQGIDTLFGLPGIQNDWLYNALFDKRDQIKVIHTRHEQGTSYMALGYAQATGKPAVFNVVPGPGILNASAGLAHSLLAQRQSPLPDGPNPQRQYRQGQRRPARDPAAIRNLARIEQVVGSHFASRRCRAQSGGGILRDELGASAAGRIGSTPGYIEDARRSAR